MALWISDDGSRAAYKCFHCGDDSVFDSPLKVGETTILEIIAERKRYRDVLQSASQLLAAGYDEAAENEINVVLEESRSTTEKKDE